MNRIWDAIVIGGGQAGLATGYHLQKSKLQFLILESEEGAAGSWPKYYDSLKLFSPARFSSLPGMKIPGVLTVTRQSQKLLAILKIIKNILIYP